MAAQQVPVHQGYIARPCLKGNKNIAVAKNTVFLVHGIVIP
jgi:hypothetical protein